MYISDFQLSDYKSFPNTNSLRLGRGFNVIVGQNNVGKTALMEGLSLRFQNNPHRSLRTVPTPNAVVNGMSSITVGFQFERDELLHYFRDQLPDFYVAIPSADTPDVWGQRFLESIYGSVGVRCTYSPSQGIRAYPESFGSMETMAAHLHFTFDRASGQIKQDGGLTSPSSQLYTHYLGGYIQSQVFGFKAERMNIAEHDPGNIAGLQPNAQNLAQVLSYFQTRNPVRFQRYLGLVMAILPQVRQITIPTAENGKVRILVWNVDPATERDDLAMSLAESGTGIGQVLAILYVVITSDRPRVIIIDEPQSFLHPGAVRKLFEILRTHFPQHQYIVTTHSPAIISSVDPSTLLLLRKDGEESTITNLKVTEARELRQMLAEVGARLSDVFGVDNVLWVEGATEELCFPLILREIAKEPLMGTAIVGVKETGALEGKHAETVYDLYHRMATGYSLLPAAIGFVFDREGKTDLQRADLTRKSRGVARFLMRRMYENYLLHPGAIAAVISGVDEGRAALLTAEEVQLWLRESEGYGDEEQPHEDWLNNVHGANILKEAFRHFTESRVPYDKVAYDVPLTEWLIKNSPQNLQPIAELLRSILRSPMTHDTAIQET